LLERLVAWLRDSRAELTRVAIEKDFRVQVGDASISGRVDPPRTDAQGRLVVVDLKTGKASRSRTSCRPCRSWVAYSWRSSTARSPTRATPRAARCSCNWAAPCAGPSSSRRLSESDDPQWVRRAVDHVAERMRGYEFDAIENGAASSATCAPAARCNRTAQVTG